MTTCVARIVGAPEPGVTDPGTPSVVVADDLAPADTAGLDPRTVLALVTERGGPTSHTAIIARQLGIPCVVACEGAETLPDGALVLVDGATGAVVLDPDPDEAAREVAAARAVVEAAGGHVTAWDGARLHVDAGATLNPPVVTWRGAAVGAAWPRWRG